MTTLLSLCQKLHTTPGPFVLVTLVSVEGSSYRKAGASLLLQPDKVHGLLSGGCLEGEIARRCAPLFEGPERAFRLSLDTRQFLGCDGRLGLWCERVESDFLERIVEVAKTRQSRYCVIYPDQPGKRPEVRNEESGDGFCQKLVPPRRLFVFGSAPDAAPLLSLGKAMGWEVQQIVLASDPLCKTEDSYVVLAEAARVSKLAIDETTACIVMNHHFGRDLELLNELWESPTRFLGLLGSRKRRDQLLEQLSFGQSGLCLESRELYAPVGLNLGADGPQEIALEICAQIQQVLSKDRKAAQQTS